MGGKISFRRFRIRKNMWWTRYRFENPWAIGRLVIWSGRRGATLTNEIPGANFARLVLTRSLPMTFFTQSEFSCFFRRNSWWILLGILRNSAQFRLEKLKNISNLRFIFIFRILTYFQNSYLFQEFCFAWRILIHFMFNDKFDKIIQSF